MNGTAGGGDCPFPVINNIVQDDSSTKNPMKGTDGSTKNTMNGTAGGGDSPFPVVNDDVVQDDGSTKNTTPVEVTLPLLLSMTLFTMVPYP